VVRRRSVLLFVALPLAAACGRPAPVADAPAEDPAARRAELERLPAGRQFVDLGCVGCHGPDAQHHQRLRQSLDRPLGDVVTWILDPQTTKPGTEMPAYKDMLDEAEARRLAEWVQQYARTIK
jgi:mono/diheme cytochrome c family protein